MLWRPSDQSDLIHDLEEATIKSEWGTDPSSCGVDIKGKRHDDTIACPNQLCDETGCMICTVKERQKLASRLKSIIWTPAVLDLFWQNGIRKEDMRILEEAGLVWSYRYLYKALYSSVYAHIANIHLSALAEII